MKISKKDAEVLAIGYESNFWKVFRKVFMEERQMDIAQHTAFLPDMDSVLISRGRIMELRDIDKGMEAAYKKKS